MHPFCTTLQKRIRETRTCLCVGLDPDPAQIPSDFGTGIAGVTSFLEAVIEISLSQCVAFKPNISFFEALGLEGLALLAKLRTKVPHTHAWIIDGKRGDIGNTSSMQATFLFDILGADAVTLHPYMGEDSVVPFLSYKDKFSFVLGLTSNKGAETFQKQQMATGFALYHTVLAQIADWRRQFGNIGAVVGATQADLNSIRKQDPELLMLIPGVGTQGGRYHDILPVAKNQDGLALINVSRAVLYNDQDHIRNFECNIRNRLSIYRDIDTSAHTDVCHHGQKSS